ncbi:methionyl-tRNA formyltransferase [Halomonas sp. 3D7M]|uniref:methionyl-tRNA formyltransferase n=1 Tax=Halomonas sp. 3D7M TaxID=2742617 RepID=UPI0018688DA9|nr:methionyl-tRNA formyltransferase [Halomonas sp. 3D7M]
MKFKSISPASDWFFRHDAPQGSSSDPILYHVAVWAVTENDEVIGLIAAFNNGVLHTPPPVPGCYLHRDQLNENEKRLISKR